jgi:hypothetical protein
MKNTTNTVVKMKLILCISSCIFVAFTGVLRLQKRFNVLNSYKNTTLHSVRVCVGFFYVQY